jgi:hypothetical protein
MGNLQVPRASQFPGAGILSAASPLADFYASLMDDLRLFPYMAMKTIQCMTQPHCPLRIA